MKCLVITGQTATGKTKLALQKAVELNGELINADSRQIYKELDIITGKDLPNHSFEQEDKIHNSEIGYYKYPRTNLWLYDITSPNNYFSSYDYCVCAELVIRKLLHQHKTPIIVGGSYLYLQHLLYGFNVQAEPNWSLRQELDRKTVKELQQILQQSDNSTWEQLNNSDKANPRRLMRKIEIAQTPRTTLQEPQSLAKRLGIELDIEMIGLKHASAEQLKNSISQRVEDRIQQGAYTEVKHLLKKYPQNAPGLKTIGYQQIIDFFNKKIDETTLKQLWITKELQYAKRQYTFMKKDVHITWLEI